MAKGAIINFFEAATADKELHKKLAELAEEFVELAKENGFDFTTEELLEFGTASPLFDEEMQSVEGGSLTPACLMVKPTPLPF